MDEIDMIYERDKFSVSDNFDDGLYAKRIKGLIEVAMSVKYTLWLNTSNAIYINDDFLVELQYAFAERYARFEKHARDEKKRGGLKKLKGEYVVTIDSEPVTDSNSILNLKVSHDGKDDGELLVAGFMNKESY